MRTFYPSDRVLNRAVELWKRALTNPIYANTHEGEPEHEIWTARNARMFGAAEKNSTPEIIDAFGAALLDNLKNAKDDYIVRFIEVDYQECGTLRDAAQRAGLKTPMPIKTRMTLYDNYLAFTMGYGSPYKFHYPLADDSWLVCSLQGNDADMACLIRLVEASKGKALIPESWIEKSNHG